MVKVVQIRTLGVERRNLYTLDWERSVQICTLSFQSDNHEMLPKFKTNNACMLNECLCLPKS